MFHRTKSGTVKSDTTNESMNKSKAEFQALNTKRIETPSTGMNQTAVRQYAGSQDETLATHHSSNENSTAPYAVKQEIEKQELKEARPMNNSDSQSKNPSQQDNSASQARVDIPGNNFQRPGMPAQASRPAYPGNYPGAAAPASAAVSAVSSYTAQANDAPSERQLIIGKGITMSGEIEACDHLVVEGTVEAALKGASMMDIAESGSFYGTVEIEEANISGRFEGDITVKGRLTITSTGIIIGSISYKELSMEAGATLDGSISPIGSQNTAKQKTDVKKSAPSKSKKVAQNSGAELPFSEQAAVAAE